jgi:GH24 family phage-related lysozyme (muramidase)
MRNKNWAFALLGVLAIALLAMQTSIFKLAASLIIRFEGFRSNPYWDVSRYSWGYGTQAPGSTGTITRAQAFADLVKHVTKDYQYLKPLIARNLGPNQWAALLSFSYNLGPGAADNLVQNINSGDWEALGIQWNKYIYAGGVQNEALADRRAIEWETFLS